MTFSSGRVLEFEALRELLNSYAVADLGKAKVDALQPVCNRAGITGQQQLVIEVLQFLRGGGRFDFSGWASSTTLVEKGQIAGAALETTEIRDLLALIDRAAQWREIILRPPTAMKLEWDAVAQLSSGIADFTGLLRYFRNKILPDGTLDDRASPALGRIRREIEKQRRSIQESFRGYLRRVSQGGALQEELITIR